MSLSVDAINDLLNDSFKQEKNTINTNINDNLNTSNNSNNIIYELLIFTDGAHERVKQRSSFGIYIQCKNKLSQLYQYNETKIIKKIGKDHIIYNLNNLDLHYHSLFKNTINDKCKFDNCNYFGIYTNNKNDAGEYCKIHKNDSMLQTMSFINYDPTNIRAEGLAIVYALIYIKFIKINIIDTNDLVNHFNTFQFNKNKLEFKEYNIPKETNGYTFYQIITDSEFWINVITKWSNNWIKQKKILEKKNIDIIYYINILLNELLDNNIIIHFKFVRGHADTKKNNDSKTEKYTIYQKGNIIADKLANIAKENINNNVKISFT